MINRRQNQLGERPEGVSRQDLPRRLLTGHRASYREGHRSELPVQTVLPELEHEANRRLFG